MGELLMVWLTRLPNPVEIWSRAAASGGSGWLALSAGAGIAAWFAVWWVLRLLFPGLPPIGAAFLFIVALATGGATFAALWTIGGP